MNNGLLKICTRVKPGTLFESNLFIYILISFCSEEMARVTAITAIFNAHCLYNADRQMRTREKGEREEFIFHLVFKRWNTILQTTCKLFKFFCFFNVWHLKHRINIASPTQPPNSSKHNKTKN